MSLETATLIKTLDKPCVDALQGAAGLCLARTNYSVEVEHWLLKLLEPRDGDLARILRHFEVDASRVRRDLTRVIEGFKSGNARTPSLAPEIDELIREAWILASLQFQASKIRPGVLLLALLSKKALARQVQVSSRELAGIDVEPLSANLMKLVGGSSDDEGLAPPVPGESPLPSSNGMTRTPALDQFTLNLTERARSGQIDPVLGREAEVRQLVDILVRRRQNNPILTGEAGVGKTAVVEGFALRIAEGNVPDSLKNVTLRTLDLGLLQAGAGVKGEFENRLKNVILEVKASPTPIILFIDEAHTMIGAGGQAGQGDAANLLKPALARGELRTIAATTWAEYKKYFEKDAALARRFQVIKVEEPTEDRAIVMMRGLISMLEKHHGVRILEEAVEASVKLSARYIPGRQLPDKSVSVLDTACARIMIAQKATPSAIEDCHREIDHLNVEIAILDREIATGGPHDERRAEKSEALSKAEIRLAELASRWESEKAIVGEIHELRERIEAGYLGEARTEEAPRLKERLESKLAELRALQGETPLIHVCVDAQAIAEVVAGWTGIPVGRMLADEIKTVLNLRTRLGERVIGQGHALESIGQRIRTSRANLTDPRRPIGVFLMVGPSGVGKTETALALAETLHGGEGNLITINMSEYQESHTVSGLKGSPPGYVGYGEGGVLTEAVRRKPYSVVLLDEVEKAHPDVMELFFQVFDKGILEDGEGREVDFKNTVILLTSNVGTDTIMRRCADPGRRPDSEALAEILRPDLLQVFSAALLGRMITVPYYPIDDETMKGIIRLQLGRIARRLRENHRATFRYDETLITNIASRCKEVESGARNVDHILTRTLLPKLSEEFLSRMSSGEPISEVFVDVDEHGEFEYSIR